MPVTTPTTTPITLYNTRTRTKEPFAPIDPKNVRMYVCGPTVYDRAHIGNARPVVVFDTLFRLLRHVYGEDHVTYVRNFTDVDDKINKRAAETLREGETELQAIRRITEETIGWYHADMDALGARRPESGPNPNMGCEPRATGFITSMIDMIETLIEKKHAYPEQGHVLFSVWSYPDYGTFAKRSLDEMRAGARVEVAPYKRDPMDFVLWKPSSPDQPGWESPWGRGRPGWHIECSAMSYELLGESFDIHGGGIDLLFPHHENEIAQSRCAHPGGLFANVWMHNEFVHVEGEKMAKSLGNFVTVRDLLEQGYPGEVIRFVLLSTHYRKPMDVTEEKLEEAVRTLGRWYELIRGIEINKFASSSRAEWWGIVDAVASDLNTPLAIQRLRYLAERAERGDEQQRQWLKEAAGFMGFLEQDSAEYLNDLEPRANDLEVERIESLLQERARARVARDYGRADKIRDHLGRAGVEIRDEAGTTVFEISRSFDANALMKEIQ